MPPDDNEKWDEDQVEIAAGEVKEYFSINQGPSNTAEATEISIAKFSELERQLTRNYQT